MHVYHALHKSDQLSRDLTFLIGSLFVKSSLDLQFLVEKLRKVQACRNKLMSFILSAFDEKITSLPLASVQELDKQVSELVDMAVAEEVALQDWIQKSSWIQRVLEVEIQP